MEVTLLVNLGDHKKGTVLDIKDETVIKKWKEIGVIADDEKPKNTSKENKKKEA